MRSSATGASRPCWDAGSWAGWCWSLGSSYSRPPEGGASSIWTLTHYYLSRSNWQGAHLLRCALREPRAGLLKDCRNTGEVRRNVRCPVGTNVRRLTRGGGIDGDRFVPYGWSPRSQTLWMEFAARTWVLEWDCCGVDRYPRNIQSYTRRRPTNGDCYWASHRSRSRGFACHEGSSAHKSNR